MTDKKITDDRYAKLLADFSELQAAAQKVCDEMGRIIDNDPYPLKYRAPFGAIGELQTVLAKHYGLSR